MTFAPSFCLRALASMGNSVGMKYNGHGANVLDTFSGHSLDNLCPGAGSLSLWFVRIAYVSWMGIWSNTSWKP